MTDSGAAARPAPAAFDGWAVIDLDMQAIVRLNDQARELLGRDATELPTPLAAVTASTDLMLLTDRAVPAVRAGLAWHGNLRLGGRSVDTAPIPVMLVPHVAEDNSTQPEFASLLFASSDVGDAAVLVPDPLTGLPTRSALFRRLEQAVRRNRDSATVLVALFVDLDGLKKINDRYGHEVGDTALIETAQRISAQLPDGALAVRFGGDEFVIIYEDAADLDHAEALATQILTALHEVRDYHAISASIGIAVSRAGEVDAHELIRRADTAMYRAKAKGGSRIAVFDAEMRTKQRSDEALRASLLHAISNNGFGVAAQPIFELATGRIHGVELFIRVRDDTPYIANTNQLFRLAHEYGEAFDAAVLGRALALAQTWRRSLGHDAPRVQINISTQSLASSQFCRRVAEALKADALRPGAIAFEIDGRDVASSGDRERNTIDELSRIGVPMIVDGFGDGSLSLDDLAGWQPAMVKLAADETKPQVLKGLIRGVSSLGIATSVKSIGSNDELRRVVQIGAFAGQGNALTPVRSLARIHTQVHGPQRLGF